MGLREHCACLSSADPYSCAPLDAPPRRVSLRSGSLPSTCRDRCCADANTGRSILRERAVPSQLVRTIWCGCAWYLRTFGCTQELGTRRTDRPTRNGRPGLDRQRNDPWMYPSSQRRYAQAFRPCSRGNTRDHSPLTRRDASIRTLAFGAHDGRPCPHAGAR